MTSAFCLVLHAHQPYVRRHGAWPCGEDWYHQAAMDAYLPVAEAFGRLAADGLRRFATVSFTPVLASQMADPYLTRELLLYAGRTMLRAESQAANYRGSWREEVVGLAARFHRSAGAIADRLQGEWSAGTHVPWRGLAASGAIETWTSAPGHAFLPGLNDEDLMAASFRAAIVEHLRVLGVPPAGAWLPECAYRPGLEAALSASDLPLTVLDGPALEDAGASVRIPIRLGDVVVLGRDRDASLLVSGPGGYPGGAAYRDFHHYDDGAGFKSFAVTTPPGTPGPKRPYDPGAGSADAVADAHRFAAEVERRLAERPGVMVCAFDLELFGHWWHEGPIFLEEVLRALSTSSVCRPETLSAAAERVPHPEAVSIGPSTWGRDGDETSWRNAATAPLWYAVGEAETRLRGVLQRPGSTDAEARGQAIREFLLLAASDWPYMITMGRAAGYARDRATLHARAFDELCDAIEGGAAAPNLAELRERDNLLPELDAAAFLSASSPARP